VPALEPVVVPAAAAAPGPAVPARTAANEPVTAERREVGDTMSGRPRLATVGPRRRWRSRTTTDD
jgi:hypothetical protein